MRAEETKQKSRLGQIDKQMNAKRKEHAVEHKQYVKAEDEHKTKVCGARGSKRSCAQLTQVCAAFAPYSNRRPKSSVRS